MDLTAGVRFLIDEMGQDLAHAQRARQDPHLSCRGVYLHPHDCWTKLKRLLDPKGQIEFLRLVPVEFNIALQSGSGSTQLFDALMKQFAAENPLPKEGIKEVKPEPTPTDSLYFNDKIKTPLSKLKLIINVEDRKRSFLYDPIKDFVYRYDYDLLLSRIKTVLGNDGFSAWMQSNTIDCLPAYRPLGPRLFTESSDNDGIENETEFFNLWKEALWKKNWTPDPQATIPPEFDEFMRAFAADDESRHYLLAWLRDATFERAEPILILCGKPGAGKNIFIEHTAGNLVGLHNYRSASRGFNKSAFHNGVSQCRIFFLDEMGLTPDSRDTLKNYHNGAATIERKGKDVGDPEKIHASFALANNFPQHIKLEYTDRKFFAPILSDTPLLVSLGKEKIEALVSRLKNDKGFLQRLASYLYHNFSAQAAAKFEKTAFFKMLCINSFPVEFRAFIHACTHVQVLNNKTMARARRRAIDPIYLRDLIAYYESQFGEPLADLVLNPDSSWVAHSKIYEHALTLETPTYVEPNGHALKPKSLGDCNLPGPEGFPA